MELKKTKKADLRQWRAVFFLSGLVFTLAVTLLAFEWKSHPSKIEISDGGTLIFDEDFVSNTQRQKPMPKKPLKVVADKIRIIDDSKDIDPDDDLLLGDEWDPDMYMDTVDNQKYDEDPDVFFAFPEIPPKFNGNLQEYLVNNTKFPALAKEMNIQGTVFVKFRIGADGKTSRIEVLRGVDKSLDEEAKRVVRSMPPWEPARQGDRKVSTEVVISVKFILK